MGCGITDGLEGDCVGNWLSSSSGNGVRLEDVSEKPRWFSDDLGVGTGCQLASCPSEYDGGGFACGYRCLTSSTNVRGRLVCVSGVG